jgi:TonB family protein
MLLLSLLLVVLQAQPARPAASAPQVDQAAVTCQGPLPAAGPLREFCLGEQARAVYDSEKSDVKRMDKERVSATLRSAAEHYRRAADLAREDSLKALALERLADVHGEKYLNEPAAEELVIRELVRLRLDDLSLHFRLARLQEKLSQPDAAEGTLLNVRYLYPDKQEVYRELASFYARRTTALFLLRQRARSPEEIRPGQPDEDGVYRVGGTLPPPAKVQHVAPTFPPEAVRAGIEGVVIAEVVIDEAGRVRDATIVRSIPLLDEAALAAVRRWQFKPAIVDGRVVPVRMTVTVNFTPR